MHRSIKFVIGGRAVDPKQMQDALMQAVLENVRAHMTERLGAMRDPDTGEFPIVVVRGDSIDQLSVHVEGAPSLAMRNSTP